MLRGRLWRLAGVQGERVCFRREGAVHPSIVAWCHVGCGASWQWVQGYHSYPPQLQEAELRVSVSALSTHLGKLPNRRVDADRPFAMPGPRYSHSQRTMDTVRTQPLGELSISGDSGDQLTGKSTKAPGEISRPRRELFSMVSFP